MADPDGRERIRVEGVIAAGDTEHRVFGVDLPQVPATGDDVEHPEGVVWTVVGVRWRVPAHGDPAVSAVLTVEPR